jgi:ABC-type antimicrobial peptide transport system permease subunit
MGQSANEPMRTVIGVVADIREMGYGRANLPSFFIPSAQDSRMTVNDAAHLSLIIRGPEDSAALKQEVATLVRGMDAQSAVSGQGSFQENVDRTLANEQFQLTLLLIFAALAVAMAAIGTYAVTSHAVAQRTQELGIRMAIGAQPGAVQWLVLRRGMVLTAAGIALGLGAAGALSRTLSALVYDVSTLDPLTFSVVAIGVGAIALLATYLPARRATRIDPRDAF